MSDSANFIALIEAHEKLLASIRNMSRLYFVEAVTLNGDQPERVHQIGTALDDLHVPVENNIRRLRNFLDAQNTRQSSTQVADHSGCP